MSPVGVPIAVLVIGLRSGGRSQFSEFPQENLVRAAVLAALYSGRDRESERAEAMRSRSGGAALQQVQILFDAGAVGMLTDAELLDHFVSRREEAVEAAFGALLRRHGPMVLGVCRGVLGDRPETEDAFQATFLVLVHRACNVRERDSLGR